MIKKIIAIFAVTTLTITGLTACSPSQEEQAVKTAVAIEATDECHLCGMIIENFSGPKGQLFHRQDTKARKFCSTRDALSYYFEPENKRNVVEIYVHDMAVMPWDVLDDNHFIDGRKAWYVIESSKRGAMGATLASFAQKQDAQAFANEFGGKVLSFEELTPDII